MSDNDRADSGVDPGTTGDEALVPVDMSLLRGMTQPRVSRRDALKYAGAGVGAMGLSAFLAACGVSGSNATKTKTGSSAMDVWKNAKKEGTLNFANWTIYIDKNSKGKSPTLEKFTKQTGITVNYKTDVHGVKPFLAKIIPELQAGQDTGYDLIVETNGGGVEPLIKLGYLIPLDHSLLPNFAKYASPAVKSPDYDPGNKYTIAWQSGFTAIGYNSKVVTTPPTSFADLMNPKYKGKIGMFADPQDLPCPALAYLNYDIQTSTPEQWKKAADLLEKQKPLVRSYYDDSYIDALENGDTVITQAWSGDIFIAAAPKSFGGDGFPELKLTLPKEGAVLWTDNMCIPLHAQHPVDAAMMMNFVYKPPIAAEIADWVWYVSPVPDAKSIVKNKIGDPTVADSPLVFPTPQDLAKTHNYKVFKDQAEEDEWNSIFEPIYTS
ncbi:MAG: extracellular solute-binding protein [Actinomycetota bacterium]|nr:extracellular solute-binding protein [Actinomycetota bacterium]